MSLAIKFKKDVYTWMEEGPFTAEAVKNLAGEALATGIDISEEIAATLYRLSADQIELLYEEFQKFPDNFDKAYWILQTKDILNMKDDQLMVLSHHVGDGMDILSEIGRDLDILLTSPQSALKFFHLLKEGDAVEKKQREESFESAIVGQVHTLNHNQQDTESKNMTIRLSKYGERWKIREKKPDGRFVFIPVKGGKFSFTTATPWTQFN